MKRGLYYLLFFLLDYSLTELLFLSKESNLVIIKSKVTLFVESMFPYYFYTKMWQKLNISFFYIKNEVSH